MLGDGALPPATFPAPPVASPLEDDAVVGVAAIEVVAPPGAVVAPPGAVEVTPGAVVGAADPVVDDPAVEATPLVVVELGIATRAGPLGWWTAIPTTPTTTRTAATAPKMATRIWELRVGAPLWSSRDGTSG